MRVSGFVSDRAVFSTFSGEQKKNRSPGQFRTTQKSSLASQQNGYQGSSPSRESKQVQPGHLAAQLEIFPLPLSSNAFPRYHRRGGIASIVLILSRGIAQVSLRFTSCGLLQPAPKYHTKGCSRSSVDSPGVRTPVLFAAFEPISSCEFRASLARTPFCAILWRSPRVSHF